jgi:hypothetical protein
MRLKTPSVRWLGGLLRVLGVVTGFWAALASAGCSDDDSGAAATLTSCNAYCEAYAAAMCVNPFHADVDACKFTECDDTPWQPSGCQDEAKAYFDCRQAQTDLCGDDGCEPELQTLLTCS